MNFLIFTFTILLFITLGVVSSNSAFASHNPTLYVSAENPQFDNHFTGSMVVEVVINDQNLRDTDEGKGEPDVTLNGKTLRMVQGSSGQWYAYFANLAKAKTADQIFENSGIAGVGLDFGVFCSSDTDSSVLGASFSDSDGVAVPRSAGLTGFTDGNDSFSDCTGTVDDSALLNNVVRNPRSINTNSAIPTGQIGLDKDAWPIIQLFSFDNVIIQYNKGGGPEQVNLEFDESQNVSLELDRDVFPKGAEVFVTISDMQLNQDPTARDSWTFNVGSTKATFYQAFDENGNDSANGGAGLVNLYPHRSSLDFNDSGFVSMNLGTVAELKTNDRQPDASVSNGATYSQIITLVETQPNTGIFESFDDSDESVIGIKSDAPRGQIASISYNSKSTSILTGSQTATLSFDVASSFNAGIEYPVTIYDPDQNINSGAREDLDVFRSSALIPSIQIGNPITLQSSSGFQFYPLSTSDLEMDGVPATTSVPDTTSDRLIVDTTTLADTDFEKISLNLGITADSLKSLFINEDATTFGTNWINYDLRSFEKQLDVTDYTDTSIALFFGLDDIIPITIVDSGDISSPIGLQEIDDADIDSIDGKPGTVFLVINFDASDDSTSVGKIDSELDIQPIVVDFFSFGAADNDEINNAIYRLELEETASNSAQFAGTVEFTVANQLNIFEASLIQSLATIDDKIKFLVNDRMIDEEGITISYSDIAKVGVNIDVSSKSDIRTDSGKVGLGSPTYRFGQPVIVTLTDPDLNLDNDTIEVYQAIDDANSPNVDTVGDSGGEMLLEVLIKDFRYQRCVIDGKEIGGLAATGFVLQETGSATGVFKGIFKMPSRICDKTGTKLISTAGGSIEVKYHDFRDSSGEPNIFSTDRSRSLNNPQTTATLSAEHIALPKYKETTDVVLTGNIANYFSGTRVYFTLVGPDESSKELIAFATNRGNYKVDISLNHESLPGTYLVYISYLNNPIGKVSFQVHNQVIPEWVKNNAGWWSQGTIDDKAFVGGIQYMMKERIIEIPELQMIGKASDKPIPEWVKNNAKWWADGLISEGEFVNGLKYMIENGIIRIS